MKKKLIVLLFFTFVSLVVSIFTAFPNECLKFFSPTSAYAGDPDESESGSGDEKKDKYALYSNPEGTFYCCGEGNVRPDCMETPKCPF